MTAVATVGVHNDFAASEAGVAHRPANDEAAGRVDVIFRFCVEHVRGNDRLDHVLHDRVAQIFVRHGIAVLRGDDYGIYAEGLAIAVFDGDLGLAIGAEEIHFLALADFGETLRQAVCKLNRHGHELFGFVAGVTEHQALVAGAAGVHAHRDVGRLAHDGAHDRASGGIKSKKSVVVADLLDSLANQIIVVDDGRRGDFTGNDDQACRDQSFAGDPALGVLAHNFIEYRIRNLIGNFVRVAFRHRLGGEQKVAHVSVAQNKSPQCWTSFFWEGVKHPIGPTCRRQSRL